MLSKSKMDRINFLAKKSKSEGLSPEEKEEQQVLRAEYLKKFRENFKARLENIDFVDEEGNVVDIKEIKNKNRKC